MRFASLAKWYSDSLVRSRSRVQLPEEASLFFAHRGTNRSAGAPRGPPTLKTGARFAPAVPGATPVPQLPEIACWRLVPGARATWQGGILGFDEDAGGWAWDDSVEPDAARRDLPVALWTPPLLDAHTHLGDAFMRPERDTLPRDLGALVAPPDGIKHQRLRTTDDDTIRRAVRLRLDGMAELGTTHALDFREGGAAGAKLLATAAADADVTVSLYGRPHGSSRDADAWTDELEQLLETPIEGIGLSALRDLPSRLTETAADLCRSAHKPLAFHLSEPKREPMDDALALNPAFLVHLTHATTSDLSAMADARVLAVTCPTSNAFFGAKAPISKLFDAYQDHELGVAFGTDNAMLSDGDLKEDARLAATLAPRATLDFLLRGLTWTPWQHLALGPDPSDPGLLWGVHRKAPRTHPDDTPLAKTAAVLADGPFAAPKIGR